MMCDGQLLRSDDGFPGGASVLRDSRQRRVLSILLERSHPVTERDLAVALATGGTDSSFGAATEADRRSIRLDLYHSRLPKLEAVGWIERCPEGIIASGPIVSDELEELLIERETDGLFWEAISDLLARPRRKYLASVIADQCNPVSLDDIATELTDRDIDLWTDRRECNVGIRGTLHHVDLPKLADIGLITYDSEERIVSYSRALVHLLTRIDLGNGLWSGGEYD